MGRPGIKIDPHRLKREREESGLTQLALAKRVHRRLGKSDVTSEATLVSDYQRIEAKGHTSPERAKAIADELGISVELLKGLEIPEPVHYLQGLIALLQRQIDRGSPPELLQAVEQSKTENGDDQALAALAEAIGERIEVVQLSRNPAVIAELVVLTGLSSAELMPPANVLGHWFVAVTSLDCNQSDIVHGTLALRQHIQDLVADRLDHFGSDGAIRMVRDAPWFRLEIERPGPMGPMRIDFVSCQGDSKGLRWIPASWREQFWIEHGLADWANSTANFVTDFEGQSSPGDLRHLRLIVTQHAGSCAQSQGRMVIAGHLDEIPETTMQGFQRDSDSHQLILSWLTADLRQFLMPYLAEQSAALWRVARASCIDIHLSSPGIASGMPSGVRYRIALMEELSPNAFVRVPWRETDRATLQQQIEQWLQEPMDGPGGDEPPRRFEPT